MSEVKLDKRIEIWHKVPFINELGEDDFKDDRLKTIWARIIPQTGSLQKGVAETILTNVTTKYKVRYLSGKDIAYDMWIVFNKKRNDIKYILNPYESNEYLEIFCEEVIL